MGKIIDHNALIGVIVIRVIVYLDHYSTLAVRKYEVGATLEERQWVASNTDIAVENYDGSPGAFCWQFLEHGTAQHWEAALLSNSDRCGRHVDAECDVTGENCGLHDAPWAAADIQNRTHAVFEYLVIDAI